MVLKADTPQDAFLASMLGLDRQPRRHFAGGTAMPVRYNCALPTDVVETSDELRLMVEVPGLRAEDVELVLEDDVLTVVAGKAVPEEEQGKEENGRLAARWRERQSRSFRLPRTLDLTQLQASCADGLLTIRVPVAANARARRIDVKGAAAEGK